jgi:tRNA(Ile)-lysidine synthase
LFDVAKKYNGQVVTAHHQDDMIETMALNVSRGTRWRGVAGMSDERVLRPMIWQTKQEVYEYALRRRLEWREDETNQSDQYARNRIRRQLWREQRALRQQIEQATAEFAQQMTSRYFLITIPLPVAEELLYEYILKQTGTSLLRAQLERLVVAVRTGRAGTIWHIAPRVRVKLTQKTVTIERVD